MSDFLILSLPWWSFVLRGLATYVPHAAFDRALHAAGLEDESDVVLARLEPNGKITLIKGR